MASYSQVIHIVIHIDFPLFKALKGFIHEFTCPTTTTIIIYIIKGLKMKLKFTKSIIENNLSITTNFIEKKDNSQITSHILLEADEYLTIKATDKEFGIILTDKSTQIIEKGKTTLNGKKFYEIIKALNDDFIEIEIVDNIATISQNHSIYKLPTYDANEFPIFPDINNNQKIAIEEISFIDALKKILPVIDSNNPKYELNGALFSIEEEQINLVSTDTKRLALFSLTQNNNIQKEIIVPRKAIAEIRKLFLNEFELYFDDINLIIKDKNKTFFTKLINGKFPDYKRIIPESYREIISINKSLFIKAIKQINVISTEIKLTFEKNRLEIESISDETFEAKTDIEIQSNLEYFKFAVNSKFILDFLNVIDDENFEICLNEENIPFTLKNKNFSTIIMPLTI